MASSDDRAELRRLIAEEIPEEGEAEDTLFSEDELDDLITKHAGIVSDSCVGEGWQLKAGKLSNLTRVTEGSSSRDLSALAKNAIAMAKMYGAGNNATPTNRRPARVGKLKRTGWQG